MAEDTALPSLTDFLASRQRNRCWVCITLPPEVLTQVHAAYDAGVRQWSAVAAWLNAIGYEEATEGKVNSHFRRDHHEVTA